MQAEAATAAMAETALAALPSIPRDAGGPVFRAPWEAQAFALALALHERGVFAWGEFASALGAEIAKAEAAGACRGADAYYAHWLAAVERLVAEKGVVSRDALLARKDAWDRAARATPHGEPIVLGCDRQEATNGS